MTWELKLSYEASRTFAKDHHKQSITVSGTLVGTAFDPEGRLNWL